MIRFILPIASLLFLFQCTSEEPKEDYRQKLKDKLEPTEYLSFMKFGVNPSENIQQYQKQLTEASSNVVTTRSPSPTNLAWTEEGPGNIGARVNTIAIDPKDDNTMYAGFSSGGVYKTTNGGESWNPIFDDVPFTSIGKIVVDPSDSQIVYVGTGDPNISGFPILGGGLYKSTDGGNTWEYKGLKENFIISDIIINETDPNQLLVSTMGLPMVKDENRGLFKSTDAGETWEKTLYLDIDAGIIEMANHKENPNVVLASGWNRYRTNQESIAKGDDAKIFRSTDFGQTWEISQTNVPDTLSRPGVCFSEKNPEIAYALFTGTNQQIHSIHKSVDGGITFNEIEGSSTDIPGNLVGGFGWYFGKIAAFYNPVKQREDIFVLGVNMFTFNEASKTWDMVVPEWWTYEVHADKHDIQKNKAGKLILGTDGGMYRSDFNFEWEDIENIATTQFYRVAYNPFQPDTYAGGAQDNGTSFGNKETINEWQKLFGGDGFQPYFYKSNENKYYCATQNGGIYYVNNEDGIYAGIFADYEKGRSNWDTPYIIDHVSEDIIYAGTSKFLRSFNDNGNFQWEELSGDLTDGNIYGSNFHTISTIHQSTEKTDLFYVGTTDGNVWRYDDEEWTAINKNIPDQYITCIRPGYKDENSVFLTVSGYKYNDFTPKVYKSNDKGETWEPIQSNLPELSINDIYIHPKFNDSLLIVGTDIGAYITLDAGASWERLGNNMPIIPVMDFERNESNNRLIAGTYARGIMTYPLDTLESLFTTTSTYQEAELTNIKVYPNPVTDYVTIESKDILIQSVEMYTISGQKVREKIVNSNEATLNCTDLTTGNYIVRTELKNGKIKQSKIVVQ